ncbi:ACCELERATED CELL DEATH 6-like [Olea europaea subsp. europaea]|uniref:ACCELERATED CELL DEATH 6-like n=1 Tax=Olea europaea subsp. europaea TaxID=158383 RepID=A0A8S0S7U6_OLEEU|nr:ACCELERATED CELL DEATH 6-like [Olea europaea subsp. europaea]
MASLFSQPVDTNNDKQDPGPLIRLILQAAKDKSAQSSASVESKQPESSQSSKVVETKELAKDLNWYLPLYKAALQGDWESARKFFDQDPDAVTAKITKVSETALHVAVGTGRAIHFVKELLELIPTEALATLRDQVGQTALHYAAIFGNVKAAQILVSKNQDLPNIHSDTLFLPIHSAALYANKDMISYLLTVTKDDEDPSPFVDKSGVDLLNLVTLAEFYDLALYLVQLYPSLATLKSAAGNNALNLIAGKPSPFLRRSSLNVWQRFLYSCLPLMFGNIYSQDNGRVTKNPAGGPQISSKLCCQIPFSSKFKFSGCQKFNLVLWKAIECFVPQARCIRNASLMHQQALHLVKYLCKEIAKLDYLTAASMFETPILLGASTGNSEIVEEILDAFPPAIWSRNRMGLNIFLLAVTYRRDNVFNLLYQMSEHKQLALQLRDVKGNNILHLAGKLAPQDQLNRVSGAALQMQRELQWYKEVEKYVLPDSRDSKNSDRRTPAVEFSTEHKDLIKDGEQWMKDTANSCTVAAALIATIAFAASITVPGGNNSDNGFPIFSTSTAFIVFAVSDALSLFSSTASLLMFLSILTARYSEGDFLYSLPKRLIIGLVTLFLSITSMMIAFSATLYLVFGKKRAWTLIPVAALACLPVTLFVTLQFPLLMDMIRSTYYPGIFGKRQTSNRLLF